MITGTHKRLMEGIECWENRNGVVVLKVHHTADPGKRSDEWIERESAKYGGRKSAFWRSEYDIDFGARRGGLVFSIFSPDRHCIPPFDVPEEWPKYRVIDPGFRNACACAWFTVDYDGNMLLYRELYKQGWKIEALASSIKALSARERYEMTLIDPSAFAKTLAGGGRSVSDLFIENGVPVSPAYRASHKKDQFFPLNELLVPRENGEPCFKVFNSCETFIAEMLQYRWKEARDDGFEPEEPVKVDDHLIDCVLYMAAALDPRRVAETAKVRDPLRPWYSGSERRRRMADERRVREAVTGRMKEYEP
ncbi:MAG: hypothetical protein FJZ00_01880 [Candidatus Sericytochromatia bacterium]|uniref:Terminase large subunit gp17-like C-terminal domain-containing protein n=1 Tax=Candidatus Tanganyikabacteria bacterium TaxID=2961651 RepID=A0A938BM34_9BACT|nr:hypothetical protein [Candidatus Tanganyikabacteria bacterium]